MTLKRTLPDPCSWPSFTAQVPMHPMSCCFPLWRISTWETDCRDAQISVFDIPDVAQVIAGWLLRWPGVVALLGVSINKMFIFVKDKINAVLTMRG